MKYWSIFAALIGLLPLGVRGQIPSPVLPEGVGMNIHFVEGHEKDLDLIAAAGFKYVRMDFGWSSTEGPPGQYQWSAYDELTANLRHRGLGVIYILDYTHSAYEPMVDSKHAIYQHAERHTASPRHPQSVAAFARWAAAAAKHFQGERIIWEIYNEPNGFFWKPGPKVEEYTVLALATAKAIRQAVPKAVVVGPAVSGFDPGFVETFLKAGILEYLDGVSVHPYREGKSSPETAVPEYQNLRAQIERYAPKSKQNKIPILSGEWGYSTDGKDVSPQTQADYLVRQQLCNLLQGVPLSIWYDWKNDGPDPAEREHNFGTVTQDLKPKPAYRAAATMTRELSGFKVIGRLAGVDEKDFLLLLANRKGRQKIAAWTLAPPHEARLELKGRRSEPLAGSLQMGEPISFRIEERQLTIPLDGSPKYVVLDKVKLTVKNTEEEGWKRKQGGR